jgi:hypothetical protein
VWVIGHSENKDAVTGRRLQSHIDNQDTRLQELRDAAERHRTLALQARQREDTHSAKQEFRFYKQKLNTIDSIEKQTHAMRVQSMALEQSSANIEMAKIQRQANKVMKRSTGKKIIGGLIKDLDATTDMMEDMADTTRDIDDAMVDIGNNGGGTDEELLFELDEMMGSKDTRAPDEIAIDIEVSEDERENRRLDAELQNLQPLFPEIVQDSEIDVLVEPERGEGTALQVL